MSGISRASYSPPNSCTRPKMPGVRSWFLFSTTARVRTVPERGLKVLSTKSTLPLRVHSLSSARRMRTGFTELRAEAIAPDRYRRV